MAISGFGNTKPCLSITAGILARNKSEIGRKILCRRKTMKITNHSEAIITKNELTAEKFLKEIDAACVYVNASTRFTDGFEFGFGAEIGISTQKLHARGPMGLKELTSYKYQIHGNGQIRG